ncbi:hypothetical protein Q5P01_020881 [Channa striata]|uniref:Ig-like domain-containing protein n=1 Tax=Channa striata TaxID=64152 RepID=A0AA88LYJ7_CHASR|nr:hypothetical protein Q5P01_020881 [Channa striata]
MMSQIVIFAVWSLWLQVHGQDVAQHPGIIWRDVSKSAEMNCSHNKDINHRQMYWYRQRPGETMTLVVFTAVGVKPDGDLIKYSVVKDNFETGALTVNDLKLEDSGVYFCAVSQHSDLKHISS